MYGTLCEYMNIECGLTSHSSLGVSPSSLAICAICVLECLSVCVLVEIRIAKRVNVQSCFSLFHSLVVVLFSRTNITRKASYTCYVCLRVCVHTPRAQSKSVDSSWLDSIAKAWISLCIELHKTCKDRCLSETSQEIRISMSNTYRSKNREKGRERKVHRSVFVVFTDIPRALVEN